MQSVIEYIPNGWYTTFLVNDVHIVDTVDIYTYQCLTCDSFECEHAKAVTNYIMEGMGRFCEALEVKKLCEEMKRKISALRNYTDLYLNALESKKLIAEMKQKISELRNVIFTASPKQVCNNNSALLSNLVLFIN